MWGRRAKNANEVVIPNDLARVLTADGTSLHDVVVHVLEGEVRRRGVDAPTVTSAQSEPSSVNDDTPAVAAPFWSTRDKTPIDEDARLRDKMAARRKEEEEKK